MRSITDSGGLMSSFLLLLLFTPVFSAEKTSIFTDTDPSIRFSITGNAGNVILKVNESDSQTEGYILTDYHSGSGYVAYDKKSQQVTAEFKKKFSLNHLSKTIRKEAPEMQVFVPREAVLEFNLKLGDLGLGQFDFSHIHVRSFHIDARFGEIYIDFPTLNKSIIREETNIHLTAGSLELKNIANLQSPEWRINGGVGDLLLDIGKKLHKATSIKLDLDIGQLTLVIPKGTRVEIRGTSRKLNDYNFIETENGWVSKSYHKSSPILSINLLGPLGDLQITWK